MTVYEVTIEKIQKLPEYLALEINDYVDFLVMKHDNARWKLWTQLTEASETAESDFTDYLSNLETYEDCLARGEIKW